MFTSKQKKRWADHIIGAPECHPGRDTKIPLPQEIDIWSLGCVFSVAATWIVLGYHGIEHFTKLRMNAVDNAIKRLKSHEPNSKIKLTAGNFFHDGRTVLPEITQWHKFLRDSARKTDKTTSLVLDLVDKRMLQPLEGQFRSRISSKDLCKECQRILSESRKSDATEIPSSIAVILDQMKNNNDVIIPSNSQSSSSNQLLSVVSGEDPSKSLRKLRIVNHRNEYLKSALHSQATEHMSSMFPATPPVPLLVPSADERQIPSAGQPIDIVTPGLDSQHKQFDSHYSPQSVRTSLLERLPRKRQPDKPENVWQARGSLRRQEKEAQLFGVRTRVGADKKLLEYYHDRDIVSWEWASLKFWPHVLRFIQKYVVDNAETMQEFWDETKFLLETLVMKCKGIDKNGMDLMFTAGNVMVENSDNVNKFSEAMENEYAIPRKHRKTNMSSVLGCIFRDYLNELDNLKEPKGKKKQGLFRSKSKEKRVKDVTLLVLTDGIWAGNPRRDEVDNTIINFVKELQRRTGSVNPRGFSISFIQLGEDPNATAHLQHLDDDLKFEGIP